MNTRQRAKFYDDIVIKQGGEYCVKCSRTLDQLFESGESRQLCIDHVNNNNTHNYIKNLQFLCHSCNTKKNHPQITPAETVTDMPQVSLGRKLESDFRRWVVGHYMADDSIGLEYTYLINSGAEKVECSTETIKRYLQKMTSNEGSFIWHNHFGKTTMKLKDTMKF